MGFSQKPYWEWSDLNNFPKYRRDQFGSRKGLCPYVKRLIPHTYGYSIDSGHHQQPYNGNNQEEPPSLCGNLCTSDYQCPGYQKCCPTNCGYACFDPVFVNEQ